MLVYEYEVNSTEVTYLYVGEPGCLPDRVMLGATESCDGACAVGGGSCKPGCLLVVSSTGAASAGIDFGRADCNSPVDYPKKELDNPDRGMSSVAWRGKLCSW